MIPRTDIAGIRSVAAPEAIKPITLVGDARQEVFQRLERIALGTFFRGEVLSHLQDGSFVVKVADAAVRMNLPTGANVGDTLDLTLTAKQPRLTFLLGAPPPDNTTSLSNAGRLIDRILHAAQNEGAPRAIVGKAPLASSADVKPQQLAGAMKNAVTFSGVFYESHVEQWASGDRPLATLMYEPQAKNNDPQRIFSALRAALVHTGSAAPTIDMPEAQAAHLMKLAESLLGKPEAARALATLPQTATPADTNPLPAPSAMPMNTSGDQPSAAPPANPTATDSGGPAENALLPNALPPTSPEVKTPNDANGEVRQEAMNGESVRMINLQLATLEQQRVAWQGELWPGQAIEWEISEDTPHGSKAEEEKRIWRSVVRFELPVLGVVSATIQLADGRVQVQVKTAREDSAKLLRMHGDAFSAALDSAGSPLEQLAIKSEDLP
jgi:hypothetical protein